MEANEYKMNMPSCYFEMDSDEVMYQGGSSGIHAYSAQRVMEGQEEQTIGWGEILGWSLEGLAGVVGTVMGFAMGSPMFGVMGLIGLATLGFTIGTTVNKVNEANEKNCVHTYNSHGLGL